MWLTAGKEVIIMDKEIYGAGGAGGFGGGDIGPGSFGDWR